MSFLAQTLSKYYQIAYVTNDMHRAIEVLGQTLGVSKFKIFDRVTLEAEGQEDPVITIALAMAGDIMVELIEPIEGNVEMYRRVLNSDRFQLVFHHYACRIPGGEAGWDSLAEAIRTTGRDFLLNGWFGTAAKYGYVDYTDTLGHVIEFVAFTQEGESIVSSLPQNA